MKKTLGSATILRTGPGTSIQDQGRIMGSKFGIPTSGAMDQRSFQWVNHVLQNDPSDAVLEISQPGFSIRVEALALISISGAKAVVRVNSKLEENPSLLSLQKGDILEIGQFLSGSRVYLGIKGGFQSADWLHSRSFFAPLTGQSMLKKGELLSFRTLESSSFYSTQAKPRWKTNWFEIPEIEAFKGPDWELLSDKQKEMLLKTEFHISKLSNRMGIQMEELVENRLPELPTNPVFPGTVQLTPGGKLLILMKDAGVTGGYPRILQLPENSISQLAQKNQGNAIRWVLKDF